VTSPIDTAYVDIKPRTTGFGAEAEAGITSGLAGAEAAVEAIIAAMEAEFAGLADTIVAEFRGVGTGIESALGSVEGAVTGVADSIDAQFNETQASVNSSFDSIRNNAVRDLDEVEAKAATSSGAVSGAFAKIASGAKLAGLGIGAGLGILTTVGLKSAANLEQVNIAFDSLTGSVAKGNAQFKALQQFAAATPFRFQDLTTAAQRFDAFSASIGQSQDQLIPFLNTIGNLVSETGGGAQALDSISLALGQTASQGKLTLGNLNQINNAIPGFSSVAALAAVRGESTAQVMQEISAGSINAKDGINQLLVGMQKFPGAAGAMAKQAQTLLGVFSTFQDTVSQALSNAFKPVIPAIKDSLTQITPIIGTALTQLAPALGGILANVLTLLGPTIRELSAILTPLLQAVGTAIVPLGKALSNLLDPLDGIAVAIAPILPMIARLIAAFSVQLAPIIEQLTPVITQLVSSFGDLAPRLLPVINALGTALASGLADTLTVIVPLLNVAVVVLNDLLIAITPLLPILPQLVDAWIAWNVALGITNLLLDANPFGLIVIAIAALAVGIVELVKHWNDVLNVLKIVWNFLKQFGPPVLAIFAPFIGIPLLILTHWGQVSAFFVGLWRDISSAFMTGVNAVVNFFVALPGRALAALVAFPGLLGNAIKTAINAMLFAIGFGIGLAIREFLAFPGQVILVLKTLLITLPTLLGKAMNALEDVIAHGLAVALKSAVTWVANVVLTVGRLYGRVLDAIGNFVTGLPRQIGNAFVAAYNATVKGVDKAVAYIKTLPTKAIAALTKLPGMIKGFFSDAGSWLYQAGKDIIMGLVHGIGAVASSAVDAAKGVAHGILSGVKSALGIGSPSKEFAKVGVDSVLGYQVGVEHQIPDTQAAITNIFASGILKQARAAAVQNRVVHPITFGEGAVVVNINGAVDDPNYAGRLIGRAAAEEVHARVNAMWTRNLMRAM
jgi:tape measure domain-containing protein